MAAKGRHLKGISWKFYLYASKLLSKFSHIHCKTEANLGCGALDEHGLPWTECFQGIRRFPSILINFA